ncbi:MAG TPA: LuxR C-terminal-related transcriptional regulator [Nocardioidaceae bacterium]|nr:LuxR C-terminal-related transcriptional regulator [Nocardioidaceae bacterium]
MSTRRASAEGDPAERPGGQRASATVSEPRFEVPRLPNGYVDRGRLHRRLDKAAELPLTLVSAPAGTGKTTLLSGWAASRSPATDIVWVTFEDDAGTAETFWADVHEAIRRHVRLRRPNAVEGTAPDRRRWVTALAAALARRESRLTLVLDGFDNAAETIADDLDFLLWHNGDRLRVVLLTRDDPALPLHRYRLEETLHEMRMGDLAFTAGEARELLEHAGVRLTTASSRTLNDRTRGWVAGLRFAARSLAEREDPDHAVTDVTGATGEIWEYLLAEVLDRQASTTRALLLNTCVVDVLRPGLTETLAGVSASRSLDRLAHANAFVEALVEEPGCYRMHPLFRDMLRVELAHASPRRLVRLHRKAAQWYAAHDRVPDAVRHATTIGDWREAAGYTVDGLAVGRLLTAPHGTMAEALHDVPDRITDPATAVVRAAIALSACDSARCDEELALARAGASANRTTRNRDVRLSADLLAAVQACFFEDAQTAGRRVSEAGQHLAAYPTGRLGAHPDLMALLQTSKGVALFRCGDLGEARRAFVAGAGSASTPGCEPLAVACLGYLAQLASLEGHLRRAREWANRAITGADTLGTPAAERPVAARVALAWVSVEQYELEEARGHVRAARTSHTLQDDPVAQVMLAIVQARLSRAHGDLNGALATIEQTQVRSPSAPEWLLDRLVVEEASLQLALGRPGSALHEVERLAEPHQVAGVLVRAQARMDQDSEVTLDGQLTAVLGAPAPLPALVSGWLLEAANRLRGGEFDRARVALDRSLRLAAPETMRRPFHDAPAEVRHLLADDLHRGGHGRWLDGANGHANGYADRGGQAALGHQRRELPPGRMRETLTAKELEVLRHLGELLTTDEIAASMYVSVNTIRTHVRSILRKLSASRRNEAVRRARELSLIDG